MLSDTIAAIATAPGKAGVAIVRVSGPDAFQIAEKLLGRPVEPARMSYSSFRDASGRVIDDGVVLAFKGPHSYTGEDVVEFQGHGGSVSPRRVLEASFAAGARLARRGEFTERAFLNGRIDYDQAEAVLDLINAKTDRAADEALNGISGAKKRVYRGLYDEAMGISSELEHSLDIDEGELPEGFLPRIQERIAALRDRISAAIAAERRGRIMREGALVVLAGPPNAGKSSLMNALLRENRAIVSDVPGTTRDSIEAWIDLEGYPVRLVDTAGLRESEDAIESEGVRRAEELLARADLVLGLDIDRGIRVHSKCDLGRGEGLNVSAKTGEGVEELKKVIVSHLAKLEPREEPRGVDLLLEARSYLIPGPSSSIPDPVLAANAVRSAAEALGKLIGAAYSADLLDCLFSRFCVGK